MTSGWAALAGATELRPENTVPVESNTRTAAAKVFEQLAEDYPSPAMAWVHHADWKGPVDVPLGHIDPEMPWMDAADPAHVQDFVKLLQKGEQLKPVILVKTPGATALKLSDGHHRYLATASMGKPVRSWVGTVSEDHGPWDQMHKYQISNLSAGGRAGSAGGRAPSAGGAPAARAARELASRITGDGWRGLEAVR